MRLGEPKAALLHECGRAPPRRAARPTMKPWGNQRRCVDAALAGRPSVDAPGAFSRCVCVRACVRGRPAAVGGRRSASLPCPPADCDTSSSRVLAGAGGLAPRSAGEGARWVCFRSEDECWYERTVQRRKRDRVRDGDRATASVASSMYCQPSMPSQQYEQASSCGPWRNTHEKRQQGVAPLWPPLTPVSFTSGAIASSHLLCARSPIREGRRLPPGAPQHVYCQASMERVESRRRTRPGGRRGGPWQACPRATTQGALGNTASLANRGASCDEANALTISDSVTCTHTHVSKCKTGLLTEVRCGAPCRACNVLVRRSTRRLRLRDWHRRRGRRGLGHYQTRWGWRRGCRRGCLRRRVHRRRRRRGTRLPRPQAGLGSGAPPPLARAACLYKRLSIYRLLWPTCPKDVALRCAHADGVARTGSNQSSWPKALSAPSLKSRRRGADPRRQPKRSSNVWASSQAQARRGGARRGGSCNSSRLHRRVAGRHAARGIPFSGSRLGPCIQVPRCMAGPCICCAEPLQRDSRLQSHTPSRAYSRSISALACGAGAGGKHMRPQRASLGCVGTASEPARSRPARSPLAPRGCTNGSARAR